MRNEELGYALASSAHNLLWFAKALVPCSLFLVPVPFLPSLFSDSFLRKDEEDGKEEKKEQGTENKEQGTRTSVRRQRTQNE
ncbi:MAG TPA: hypothetical protein VM223_13660 [Planctomycetota bacterium]|nr:hypothetical protein [Planctomycetota bacterium]